MWSPRVNIDLTLGDTCKPRVPRLNAPYLVYSANRMWKVCRHRIEAVVRNPEAQSPEMQYRQGLEGVCL